MWVEGVDEDVDEEQTAKKNEEDVARKEMGAPYRNHQGRHNPPRHKDPRILLHHCLQVHQKVAM